MAERRMFAKTIIGSDAFLDMPQSTQALYFHLSMRADDDGFVNSPKSIMRVVGCKDDDLRILAAKKFIIPFESGIVVIKHWRIHNYIAKDRYNETKYKKEKDLLVFDENGAYTKRIQDVYTLETQVRLGKVRLGKDNNNIVTEEKSADEPHRATFKAPSQEEVEAYCKERRNSVIAAQFCDFYESKGWMVGKSKMKSWRAAIRTWERNGYSQGGAKKPGTLDNRPDAWSEDEIAQNREAIEAMEAPTDEELAELEEIKKRASGTVAGRAIIGMLGRQ